MSNHRPVVYTERIAVAITAVQRERLRRFAKQTGTAMSIIPREAALADIGRTDLSLAADTAFTVGAMIDRKPQKPSKRHGARALINLTKPQRDALEKAAIARGMAYTVPTRLLHQGNRCRTRRRAAAPCSRTS